MSTLNLVYGRQYPPRVRATWAKILPLGQGGFHFPNGTCPRHPQPIRSAPATRRLPLTWLGNDGEPHYRQVSAVSFHSLHHTFVSLLKATGSTQAVAKELAGRSSDAMSDHYTKLPADVLSQAVKQLPSIIKEGP